MAAPCLSLLALSLSSVALAQSVQHNAAQRPAAGVSRIISPSFAGLGLEPSNLFSFTGEEQENELTKNLLQNLVDYTGVPPHIRLGGNTQDYFKWDENMNDWAWRNNPNAVGQGAFPSDHMIIGPRYFEALDRFPEGTPLTFGLNLAYEEEDYIDQIVTMATQALDRLENLNVVSFEIGNEPDLYLQNGFRTGSWGGDVYTQQWLDRAQAVYDQVLKPRQLGTNFFEPGATASTIGTSFQIDNLVSFDIDRNANGTDTPLIAQWNQHDYYHYIGVSTYTLTQDRFMDLSTTRNQFLAWEEEIQQADETPFAYALREMGIVGPIGLADITDVFGAALWNLNFFLYTAALNITMVGMHMTDNSNASAWQPIEFYGNAPHVRPNYYSFAAFDQIIGPTCQARVGGGVLDQPGDYQGRLAIYDVYQNDELASVVLINSRPANVSEANKGSMTFDLSFDSSLGGQEVHLAFLTNDGADAKNGTTWNGISYEESGDGTPQTVDDTEHTMTIENDGSLSVAVRDTEAVVVNFGGAVGRRAYNAEACGDLSTSRPEALNPGTKTGQGAAASASESSAASSNNNSAKENGVLRVSTMVLATFASALFSGFCILFA
ncbi:uncharacterized protein HMPREF1541_06836 [Cyphellophora europaea CBS 101466]|uniref:Beta-glucuronidase C-terminal domain-containing protein n=1 Tax=Cyphellophora europaea (strain CBS 101466) TaxID=1220924 RepID=W2RQR1_CYPE1|nr:uncharacterized protein HMPREF1541_06836 [Cyphellophora europaea CBS 101466]ETN38797.1 hypothetical protein HMPREF1541_06836 [Cyphellophora europaea CBS 101466]